jgi:hypothetical protein
MTHGFDRWVQLGLTFAFLVFAIKGAIEAWRLLRLVGRHAGDGDWAAATFFAG